MVRFMGVLVFVVAFVAMLVWAATGGQVGPSTAPATAAPLNSAILKQAQLDTSTANAQQTATADILLAHDRATFSAATSTQYAAQTQAVLQQTQAQFSLRLTADSATQSAAATATQQHRNESAGSTATAIAGVIAAQTQSVIATRQGRADEVRQNEAQEQETIAFLWAWGPSLFLLAVVAAGAWAFWYWEIHKRAREWPGRERAAPLFAAPAPASPPPLRELPRPEATVVIIDQYPITEPDGQVSGWLEEVKEKLLASEKDDDGNPDA